MKPVKQTKFGPKEGDCFPACLASILEIDIDPIPDFMNEEWPGNFEKWLRVKYGLYPIWVFHPVQLRPFGYYILSGKSPRGDFQHSIVMYDGGFSFDPHPEGGDSLETALESIVDTCVLAQLNPAVRSDIPKPKPKTKTKKKPATKGKKK